MDFNFADSPYFFQVSSVNKFITNMEHTDS